MALIGKLIDGLRDRLQAARLRKDALRELESAVASALADGTISDEELEELEALRSGYGLRHDDWARIRSDIYARAVREATTDRRLSPDEEAALARLADRFGIPPSERRHDAAELTRYRLLDRVERGELPDIDVPGFRRQRGERIHWIEPASLLEERTVRRRYGGSSHGVSFRIAKRVTYRIGGHGGRVVSEKELVAVSDGEFLVTNQRLIFRGDRKNFTARWPKVIDVQMYADGVRISREGRQRPALIRFQDRANAEIIAMMLSAVLNEQEAAG